MRAAICVRNPNPHAVETRWYGFLTHLWRYQPWPGVDGTPPEQLLAYIEWYPTVVEIIRGVKKPRWLHGLEIVARRAGHEWHKDPIQPFSSLESSFITILPHPDAHPKDHSLVISIDVSE
jgi:hypothetical protein